MYAAQRAIVAHNSYVRNYTTCITHAEGLRYEALVADPPWENASVRRSGRYATLPARHLLKLPIVDLVYQVGTPSCCCRLPSGSPVAPVPPLMASKA